MTVTRPSGSQPRWRPPSASAGALMALAAAAFATASIIHFGVAIPVGFATVSDPFAGAAVPEAVIALVVATGAVAVLTRRPAARGIALTATSFALLGTAYGLTVTLRSTRTGDIAYHLAILATLLVILGLLLLPGRTRRRGGSPDSRKRVRSSP